MPVAVKDSFALLTENVYSALGIAIEPVDGYKSENRIRRELRARLKNKTKPNITDQELDMMINQSPNDFEPPIGGDIIAKRNISGQELVYTIPNRIPVDPRLTGRVVQIGPKNIINPTLLYYLIYNAGFYGFVHYGPKDPSVWYWRGDKEPFTYTAEQVVQTFTGELEYLL